jgi:hypothetical protein
MSHLSTTTHPNNGDHGTVSDAPCRIRPAGPGDAEAVADLTAALATRRAAPFYRALGYEESAAYFRKVLDHQPPMP